MLSPLPLPTAARLILKSLTRSLVSKRSVARNMASIAEYTPDVFLKTQIRSAGIPNHNASKILFTTNCYDFSEHKKKASVGVIDGSTKRSSTIADGEKTSNPTWLDEAGEDVLVLTKGEKGTTHLTIGNVNDFEHSYTAGTFNGPVDHLLVKKLGQNHYALAVSGSAAPDGSLHNPDAIPKPHSSGMVWSSLFVRRWDQYVGPQTNSLFYAALKISPTDSKQYTMTEPVNALKGTGLESPLPPFGDVDSFDISPSGLVFVAKDPNLNPATHTKCNIYIIRLVSFDESSPEVRTVNLGSLNGALISPKFSWDGKMIAFLGMAEDGYEADRNQLSVIYDIDTPAEVTRFFPSQDGRGSWDRSPAAITWSRDGKTIYMATENEGTRRLFSIAARPTADTRPVMHPTKGSVSSMITLSDGALFLSSSKFVDPSIYCILAFAPASLSEGALTEISYSTARATSRGPLMGLSHAQTRSFKYPGSAKTATADHSVQVWETRGSSFSAKKKYPVAILVHGGPQLAWNDNFSPRWQPLLFAEQGFLVLQPNITGSTGFGQAFVDAIQGDWGGAPYEDLERLYDWLGPNLPYADTERVVLLGASYGGFTANWVAGRPLGKKLKALVSHCGIMSAAGMMATEELYFPNRDLGGSFVDPANRPTWLKHQPIDHVHEWTTPMLLIHGERDFRLTIGESLVAFNALQEKGVDSKLLVFPDENHFTQKPENVLVWHEEVLTWVCDRVGLPGWKSKVDTRAMVMDPVRKTEEGTRRIKLVD